MAESGDSEALARLAAEACDDRKAVDIRLSGYNTRRLHETAVKLKAGGVGFYPKSDFVHVDVGQVRYW